MIEVFADVVCPFTHVGLRRLIERRGASRVPLLHVRSWPLELVNREPLAATLVAEEVDALREHAAPELFRGFDPARFPSTSVPALSLAAEAYRRGGRLGELVSLQLRHELFELGHDISAPEVVSEIATAHGLEVPREMDPQVLADLTDGRQRGVQGSPHFFVGSEDFFCPSLEITRIGAHLRVAFDPAGFDNFAQRALDAA
jgi:predicted DsbA family dithiol-disulfide isomerase